MRFLVFFFFLVAIKMKMKWKNMMKNSQARQHIFVVAERTHFGSFGVEMNLWCLLFMMSGEINNKFVIADR